MKVRLWVNLVGVTPLLLGMMVAVPQMVVAPLVLAQSSQGRQQPEPLMLYIEGLRLQQQGTRQSLQQALDNFHQALSLFRTTGNRRGEARTLNKIGLVYQGIEQHQQALTSVRSPIL